jgi:alkylation response protein AidB-like acyl-CoA dehydrogenase
MISFSLTDEQKDLQKLARDLAQNEIAPVAPQLDRMGEYPYSILKQAHSLGLLNLTIGDAYGGGGLGWLESCLVGEEFVAACAGVTTAVNANELALAPIELAASEEQNKEVCPADRARRRICRVLRDRARRRQRRGRDAHPRGEEGRRLHPQRDQTLYYERGCRTMAHGLCFNRSGKKAPRHLTLCGAG